MLGLKSTAHERSGMSVSGLCEICGSAEADDRCQRCGTIVCEDHRDDRRGVCADCAAEFPDTESGVADPEDHPDVDRYRF